MNIKEQDRAIVASWLTGNELEDILDLDEEPTYSNFTCLVRHFFKAEHYENFRQCTSHGVMNLDREPCFVDGYIMHPIDDDHQTPGGQKCSTTTTGRDAAASNSHEFSCA
jgi:hypothetical protein